MPFLVASLLVLPALALSPTRLTRAVAPPAVHLSHTRSYVVMGRKPGVEEPSELAKFVEAAGDKLIVVDVRNTDFEAEPGDAKTNEKAPIGAAARALAPAENDGVVSKLLSHPEYGRGERARRVDHQPAHLEQRSAAQRNLELCGGVGGVGGTCAGAQM